MDRRNKKIPSTYLHRVRLREGTGKVKGGAARAAKERVEGVLGDAKGRAKGSAAGAEGLAYLTKSITRRKLSTYADIRAI
jgi:hypothetical protein